MTLASSFTLSGGRRPESKGAQFGAAYEVLALVAVLSSACLGPQDDPSQLHDLRVIGASFDPPELMAPSCAGLLGTARLPDGGASPGRYLPVSNPPASGLNAV